MGGVMGSIKVHSNVKISGNFWCQNSKKSMIMRRPFLVARNPTGTCLRKRGKRQLCHPIFTRRCIMHWQNGTLRADQLTLGSWTLPPLCITQVCLCSSSMLYLLHMKQHEYIFCSWVLYIFPASKLQLQCHFGSKRDGNF